MGPMIWGGGVMAVASAKCRVHPREPAVGYCTRCGSFGCSRCLLTCVDENLYCLACIRKLQLKVAEAASESRSARAVHLKLVVRLKNGKMLKGTSYKLDPTSKGFPLIPVMGPKAGELVQVLFEDVKSVYHVREFAPTEREGAAAGADERLKRRGGQEITIRYSDGEVLRGYPSGMYRPDQSRFWVIPLDAGNNISILVERSATFSIELATGRIRASLRGPRSSRGGWGLSSRNWKRRLSTSSDSSSYARSRRRRGSNWSFCRRSTGR